MVKVDHNRNGHLWMFLFWPIYPDQDIPVDACHGSRLSARHAATVRVPFVVLPRPSQSERERPRSSSCIHHRNCEKFVRGTKPLNHKSLIELASPTGFEPVLPP